VEEPLEHLPDGLAREEFCRLYRQHLEPHREGLVRTLTQLLDRTDYSSPVDHLDLGVFADESGDGHVSVWCYFNGPNRRVSGTEPSLFAGKSVHLTEGIRVPIHDPGAYEFSTADASITVVMEWVESCWEDAGGAAYAIPATITGHEDCCGSGEVKPLNGAARARVAPQRRGSKRSKPST